MKMFGCFVVSIFFVSLSADNSFQQSYAKAGTLLVTSQRIGRYQRKMNYLVLGRSAHTKQWGSFLSSHAPDERSIDTAVRALQEQVNGSCTLCMSDEQLVNLLSPEGEKLEYMIDNRKGPRVITYIPRISRQRFKDFRYAWFNRCGDHVSIDAIALVHWENIEIALRNERNTTHAIILLNGQRHEEYRLITLSTEFIDSIKPFFLRQSYEQGADDRIRIYTPF